MRALVLIAVVACGSSKKDECTEIKDKVRPLIEDMFKDRGKAISKAELDELMDEFCKPPPPAAAERTAKFKQCILDAADQPAVAACLKTEFEDYAKGPTQLRPSVDAAVAEADGAPASVDASPAGSPSKRPPPVDIKSLPQLAVDADAKPDHPLELIAVNESLDRVLIDLATGSRPFIIPTIGKLFTGRIKAPSNAAAFDAVVTHAGITLSAPVLRGSGPAVDFAFAEAPVRDLLRVLGDTLRVNVVDDGGLPKVDIAVRRAPAAPLLDALVKLSGKTAIRQGATIYVVAPGTKLPPLPALASKEPVELSVVFGTAADAAAALSAVSSPLAVPCGGAPIELRVRKLSAAETARAIAVAAHATYGGTGCQITETAVPELAGARLLAIARAGSRSAAVIAHGDTRELVRGSGRIEIFNSSINVDKAVLQFPSLWQPPDDRQPAAAFLATLTRTSLIYRGARTYAIVHKSDGNTLLIELKNGRLAFGLPQSIESSTPTIDERGVTFTLPPDNPGGTPTTVLVPLAN